MISLKIVCQTDSTTNVFNLNSDRLRFLVGMSLTWQNLFVLQNLALISNERILQKSKNCSKTQMPRYSCHPIHFFSNLNLLVKLLFSFFTILMCVLRFTFHFYTFRLFKNIYNSNSFLGFNKFGFFHSICSARHFFWLTEFKLIAQQTKHKNEHNKENCFLLIQPAEVT